MREMKKKKSKGEDGISQDVILLGEKALITPITHILKSYFVVLTLKYDHKKYVKYAFPKYIYVYIFVEYDWLKGKYVHAWLKAYHFNNTLGS